jgi:succinoglycan biosynthesis transport protein ExoP
MLIIPGSVLSGLILGLALGFLREKKDGVFRTSAQVEAALDVEMLGVLPQLQQSDLLTQYPHYRSKSPGHYDSVLPQCGFFNYVVRDPFSLFARTLRNAKVVADLKTRDGAKTGKTNCNIIGIVSALPNEGKTLIASNLAHLIANAGETCVLIDGDLHDPTLSRFLAADAKAGLVELSSGIATLEDVQRKEPSTGLLLIPAVVSSRISDSNEVLVSMRRVIDLLRLNVNYIIVDLPPLVPVVDAKASAHLFDGFLLVIEWGKTNRNIVSESLKGASAVYEKLIGCFLNKVDVSAMRKFEHHHDDYYKHRYYQEYGLTK